MCIHNAPKTKLGYGYGHENDMGMDMEIPLSRPRRFPQSSSLCRSRGCAAERGSARNTRTVDPKTPSVFGPCLSFPVFIHNRSQGFRKGTIGW